MKSLLTVHTSHTLAGEDVGVRTLDHRDRAAGFSKCGYHYVIRRDGRIEVGRAESEPSIHDDADLARRAVSICLIGGKRKDGVPANNFTREQKISFGELVKKLRTTILGGLIMSRTPVLTSSDLESWT